MTSNKLLTAITLAIAALCAAPGGAQAQYLDLDAFRRGQQAAEADNRRDEAMRLELLRRQQMQTTGPGPQVRMHTPAGMRAIGGGWLCYIESATAESWRLCVNTRVRYTHEGQLGVVSFALAALDAATLRQVGGQRRLSLGCLTMTYGVDVTPDRGLEEGSTGPVVRALWAMACSNDNWEGPHVPSLLGSHSF